MENEITTINLLVPLFFYDNINYNSNNNGEKSLFVQRFTWQILAPIVTDTQSVNITEV